VGGTSASRPSSPRAPQGRGYRRPFVAVTFAMTVDGKITTKNYSPVDFTSREDKTHLLRQRALGDAVLIGHSTLKHDNVRLGLPDPKMRQKRVARGQTPYPLRVILSNEGRIDASLKLFQTDPAKAGPIVIFSTLRMPARYQKALREKATLHLSDARAVDLAWMLRQLKHEYGVRSVACEGGATLFRALLEADLVDQLNLTIAPYLFGGANAPTLTGLSKSFLPRSIRCSLTDMRVVGEECFLTYRIKHRRS
jgi:5-amino-6-(5-phosphoribosylamino)uracil reductase